MTLHDSRRSLPPSSRSVRFAPLPDSPRSASVPSSPIPPSSPKRSNFPIETYPPSQPTHPSTSSKRKTPFLRPFFRRASSSGSASPSSSISLTPTPSIDYPNHKHTRRLNISAEILTLGTINLFRSAPRNVRSADHDPSTTWPTPRQSFISAGDNSRGSKRHFFGNPASTFDGKSTQQHSRKGVRMLNGRVYGARPANPFANIKDEPDPEFVEWGYGGMGSVRGQHAAGMSGTRWERLHHGDDPSTDDGTGMYWVKKRREARERAKTTREAEKTQSEPEMGTTASTTAEVPSILHSNPEHVLHAITIPANFQRHHHRSTPPEGAKEAGHGSTTDQEVENRTSESGEESSLESEEDEDDEDEIEDDEPERRTALGAGVEKYARHDPLSIPTTVTDR